jgi:putative ABC transport system permease protein
LSIEVEEEQMARRTALDNAEEPAPVAAELFEPPDWAIARGRSRASLRMAAIGVRRTWPLLIAVSLGMLAAVTLICTAPVYTSLSSEVQLQHTLAAQAPADINTEALITSFAVSKDNATAIDQRMDGLAQTYYSSFAPTSTSYVTGTQTLLMPEINGKTTSDPAHPLLAPGSQATIFGYDLAQAGPHMKLFAGRLPQETPAGQPPEALVTTKLPNVHVGDTIKLTMFGGHDRATVVKVVGVWYPKDESDPFWNGRSFDTIVADAVNPPPPVYPIVFSRATFVSQLTFTPQALNERPLGMALHYVYFTDPHRVTASSIDTTIAQIKAFRSHLNGDLPGSGGVFTVNLGTKLDTILSDLQHQFSLLSLPLYVIVAQVVGLALLFVVAMAGLLIEGQSAEIATLKSRGASGTQLLVSYTLQGILLAALAALLGPILAAALSQTLVTAFIPSTAKLVNSEYLARAVASQSVWLPALVGALLSVLALVIAALRSARLDVLAYRREQGRGGQVPFWRRYYLDVALAILCALGYLELGQFGGLNIREQLGNTDAQTGPDPLLLAAPALLLLAGALLTLRLFPFGAAIGARLAAQGRGATGMLAFSQVSRVSSAFGRLTLLLTLSVGVGLFALNYQASLGRNVADRAAYVAGADELVAVGSGAQPLAKVNQRLAALPGVQGVTPIFRSQASSADDLAAIVGILAVDPATLAGVSSWRDDYAAQPLDTLMHEMATHAQGAKAGDTDHPIWTLVDSTFANTYHLRPGDHFRRDPNASLGQVNFVVGAMVTQFPTMYDTFPDGYMIVPIGDYLSAIVNPAAGDGAGQQPNEYWLRTTADANAAAARTKALGDAALAVTSITSRRALQPQYQEDPLTAGMTGLLLIGALTAAALAILGAIAQSALTARQRTQQFAILRTLGMSGGQLVRMLLSEQTIVYCFGLLGGTALGLALSSATLPYLQFSSSITDSDPANIPAYLFVFNTPGAVLFYGALAIAFLLSLLLAARVAATVGLGKTLRLGED